MEIQTVICPHCGFIHNFTEVPNRLLHTKILATEAISETYDCLTKDDCKKFNIPEIFEGEHLYTDDLKEELYGINCLFCKDEIVLESKYIFGYAELQPSNWDESKCPRIDLPTKVPITKGIYAADLGLSEWGFNSGRKQNKKFTHEEILSDEILMAEVRKSVEETLRRCEEMNNI